MDCSAGFGSCQTRGLRALVDVSIAERSGPLLVASTTDGRGLARMCSCQRLLPSCALCAAVPVIQARLASARAQFLCHRALRSDGHSHGGACCSRGRGPSQVWGQAKTARARHAPRAPSQARSQNDGYTALILRAGSRRAGLPHPRAACHRLVQRVVGADVQPLPSVRSGRGDARLCARDGGRNGAGCRLCHRAHGRTAMPTRRPFTH